MRWTRFVFLAGCSAALAACAGTKGATDEGKGPADKGGKKAPREAQVDRAPRDEASIAFSAHAKAIEGQVEKGKVDWDGVADRMLEVTSKHPNYGPAWYNLGLAYEKLGKSEDADTAYRRAIEKGRVCEAYENLAALAKDKGDGRQAMSLLREAVSSECAAANARAALADVYLSEGDLDAAAKMARESLAREPKNGRAYCVLARVAFQSKDFQLARLIVSQGIKADEKGDHGCLHRVLGFVLLKEDEVAQGLVELEKAVSTQPNLVDTRFAIANLSMGVKDWKKAIDNYAAVTKVDPKNPAAYVNMGVCFKGSGNFDAAEKAYLKAIEVAKDEAIPEAHFNLGVLYLRHLGRLDDAKTHFKRYLQISNETSDAAFKMLEEIDQTRAMEEEAKRMEEEAKREEALQKKIEAEEAKQKAAEDKKGGAPKSKDQAPPADGEPADPSS